MSLEGTGVLVTGSTSGIGQAIAERLASEGANTVVSGRDRSRGEAVARRLSELGEGRSTFIAADLATRGGPTGLGKAAEEWLGGVDILVNNAATGVSAPSPQISKADWEAIFAINVRGPYLLCAYLLPQMAERRRGKVVNITSSVAYRGWPGYSAYAASKAAVDAMTRCWAATYSLWGVRVNAVSPGPVLTPRVLENSTPEDLGAFAAGFGVGRYGEAEEVAAAVAFLVSDEADYLYGTTLHVDGGMVGTFGYSELPLINVGREASAGEVEAKSLLRRFRKSR